MVYSNITITVKIEYRTHDIHTCEVGRRGGTRKLMNLIIVREEIHTIHDGIVFRRGWCLQSDKGFLIHWKTIGGSTATNATTTGIEHWQGEKAIRSATPSPVDMEEAFVIITVDNKLVTTTVRMTRIKHWAFVLQLIIHQQLPFFQRIIAT